ncbi:hypothetical protein [Sorangium sp. So ce1335]|uniref:hypothetical protein n=1 Tax=Sorangium sp. So ce1335 TaxID=3133335 RepID=UPI003F61EFD4
MPFDPGACDGELLLEYRADLVVVLLDGDAPSWVLIVEVQLGTLRRYPPRNAARQQDTQTHAVTRELPRSCLYFCCAASIVRMPLLPER